MKLLLPTLFSPMMTMLSPVSTSISEKLAKLIIFILEMRNFCPLFCDTVSLQVQHRKGVSAIPVPSLDARLWRP